MYESCITCSKIGISCDGPNFVAMSANELIAWCKARKTYLGLSNQRIAEIANVSKGTVDGLLAATHADFRYETIRPILKALIGGDWSGEPCPDPTNEERAKYEETIRQLEKDKVWHEDKIKGLEDKIKVFEQNAAAMQTLIANTNARATQDKDFLRKQLNDRYLFLKKKDRVIVILSILLALCVLGMIAMQLW